MAKALVVLAHPLEKSLCGHFAFVARDALIAAGHQTAFLDLARDGFDPRLTAGERAAYYAPPHDFPAVAREATLLAEAEILVLVFPTWWFSPPTRDGVCRENPRCAGLKRKGPRKRAFRQWSNALTISSVIFLASPSSIIVPSL
ncbi:MAG: NAD(P)H-dependent oxidoreductase [Phyllobacteriaceae bacterium]|nr:NAD(P)H-dependent oxidoreductase [Phyllobacteriaceae bacterium]